MKIQITQDDIDNGVIGDSNHCPIARAFKRIGYTEVIVEQKRIYLYGDTYNSSNVYRKKYIDMPENGKKFVLYYDRSEPVEPFELEVKIP